MKLNANQKKFADEYLIDFNATRAYLKAYPRCKSVAAAGTSACNMLKNAKVAEYISKRKEFINQRAAKNFKVTADRIIAEYAKIAFNDVTDMITIESDTKQMAGKARKIPRVVIKDTSELTLEQRACIASIKDCKDGIEVKFYDKTKALDSLANIMGITQQQEGEKQVTQVIFNAPPPPKANDEEAIAAWEEQLD